MKRFKWVLLGVLVVVVVVAAVLAIYIYSKLHKDVEELAQIDSDLAFISDRDGNWDIFVLGTDGTLRTITAGDDGDDYLLNYTFSGEWMYFYTNRSGEFTPARVKVADGSVEVLNFATAAIKALSDGHLDVSPQWSPDGQQLAWTKTQGLSTNLCVAPVADPNDFHCLTKDQGGNMELAWSPDGKYIAFASDRGKKQDIYVVDVASGEQTRLTNDEGWAFEPAWSEDGQWIMFTWNLDDDSLTNGWFDLYLVRPDGSDLHHLGEGETFTGDLTYSPSGQKVAYMSNTEGTWQIYTMDTDGSNVQRVTDGTANYMFPAWKPSLAGEADTASGE